MSRPLQRLLGAAAVLFLLVAGAVRSPSPTQGGLGSVHRLVNTLTPTWRPPPGPAAPASCLDLSGWSLDRRLDQLLVLSGEFSDLPASAPAASAGVGAFVFFGSPPAGSASLVATGLAALEGDARAAGGVGTWLSTDEEGGYVQRLAAVTGGLPSPRWMAANWTPGQVESAAQAHGDALRRIGIDMDLAPVVDTALATDPVADESDRSFSDDAAVAATYGMAFADGLRAAGVVPVVKHFPGFGHASGNTDLGWAADPPLAQLEQNDLVPYRRAVADREPALMVANVAVPGLSGDLPASLSPATYAYLRGTLGFGGVAMTDDLNAGAIAAAGYSEASAAAIAIAAGADMAMVDAGQWQPALAALESAVASGLISPATLMAALDRVLAAKGFFPCDPLPLRLPGQARG